MHLGSEWYGLDGVFEPPPNDEDIEARFLTSWEVLQPGDSEMKGKGRYPSLEVTQLSNVRWAWFCCVRHVQVFIALTSFGGPLFWMQVVLQQAPRCSGWGCPRVPGGRAAPGEFKVKSSVGEERIRLQGWSRVSRKSLWKRRGHV